VQFANALLPILVTFAGITTLDRLSVHVKNVFAPIVCRLVGRVVVSILVQRLNVPSILVMLFGRFAVLSAEHCQNVRPSEVTFVHADIFTVARLTFE
jgi:hypothetical protein